MIKQVFTVVFALGVCSAGALGGLYATGAIGVPDVGLEGNAWGEVEDDRIEVLTTVWIDNPNPRIELDDLTVEYDLAMNEVDLASGEVTDVAVPAGNSTTELRTDLHYQQLPDWWVSHIQNDEVSHLEADVTAHVTFGPLSGSPAHTYEDEIETDLEPMIAAALAEQEGEHSLSPVRTGSGPQQQLIEPTVEIRDTDAEWGEVTDEQTELHLTYEVHNPNAYPLPTPALTGEMEFNEHLVAEWDAHEVELLRSTYDTTIPPQQHREFTFVVVMENDDVVDWFATHVDNEEFTDAELRAQLAMNINGETMTIPEDGDAFHCEYEMTTAIFVEQDAGMEQDHCELVPWATPDKADFESLEAALDLTEYEPDNENESDGEDETTDDSDGDGDDDSDDSDGDGNETIDDETGDESEDSDDDLLTVEL